MQSCGVCTLHNALEACQHYEISRSALWILRHHPDPAPLVGWLLLDARRHSAGPVDFTAEEAAAWGPAVQRASQLVLQLTGCDRVYAIAFGEGARHLHLHLIPRFGSEPASEAWKVADLYRAVQAGDRPAATPEAVQILVEKARQIHLTSAS
ncbi:MAG: diadenosine tetraphosphate hydrolase [Cyanobacteria bacterium M_surface_9_m1_291]|nr:diadenosine tetraphosphate hydrolase [Cyanobacteria bacterium M_surface_9_m1_291]